MAAGFKGLLWEASARTIAASSRQCSRRFYQSSASRPDVSAFSAVGKGSFLAAFLGISVYFLSTRKVKAKETHENLPSSSPSKSELSPSSTRRSFANKCVLITGGAGEIGSSVALAFAKESAKVVLVDLPQTEAVLKEKCGTLVKAGAEQASYITGDVTVVDDVKHVVEETVRHSGSIDVFFNNAGIQGTLRPLAEQDDKTFKKVLDVNIYGVYLGMKYVSKAMQESNNGGVIVNTASVAGLEGPANMSAYAASKFAVVGMTKSAAKDLARHGIRVCAIAPGILEGKMWGTQIYGNVECRKLIEGDSSPITKAELEEQEARMIGTNPIQRLGKMSEVAAVGKFLCSDDASYLTGVVVPIDGGRLR